MKSWLRYMCLCALAMALGHPAAAQDESSGGPSVTVQDLSELAQGDERMNRVVVSPDGTMVAWWQIDSGLCLYIIERDTVRCSPWQWGLDNFGGEGLAYAYSMSLEWSPDSSQLLFAKNLNRGIFFDSDIWRYDVAADAFTNLTDDGFAGIVSFETDAETGQAWMDQMPFWASNSLDDILFLRTYPVSWNQQDSEDVVRPFERTEVRRVSAGSPEGTLVLAVPDSLVFNLPPAAISTDGTKIAALMYARAERQYRIWIIDLALPLVSRLITLSDLRTGLPDWATEGLLTLSGSALMQWVADDAGIIVASNYSKSFDFEAGPFVRLLNFHYVDVATGTVTPLVDLSGLPSPLEGDDARPLFDRPYAGFLSQERDVFYYSHRAPDDAVMQVDAVALPPEPGAAPLFSVTIPYDVLDGRLPNIGVMSADGRVVIGDRLLLAFD